MGYHAKFGVYEAKAKFCEIVRRVASGEVIIISRNGHAVARLVPEPLPDGVRRPGRGRGMVSIAPYHSPAVHDNPFDGAGS